MSLNPSPADIKVPLGVKTKLLRKIWDGDGEKPMKESPMKNQYTFHEEPAQLRYTKIGSPISSLLLICARRFEQDA